VLKDREDRLDRRELQGHLERLVPLDSLAIRASRGLPETRAQQEIQEVKDR